MTRTRAISLLTLSLAAIAFCQDTVTLRRELKAESKDVYKVVLDSKTLMDVPTMGEQELGVKAGMTYAITTHEAKEGKADVDILVDGITYKMEGPLADMMQGGPEMPKELKFKGKMDVRNRISDITFDGKLDFMTMSLASSASQMSTFIEFPEGPVKIGDSWDVTIPKNKLVGNEDTKFKATLIGDKDGKWHLQMSGELKIKNDLGELMKGQDPTGTGMQMEGTVTGAMKLAMDALVDKANGRTVELTTAMDGTQSLDMTSLGMKMDQKSKGTVKMTLQ